MQVGLFIPCYIDQCYPEVGLATVEVLERFGCDCDYPAAQTCCGQPMANSGCTDQVKPLAKKFIKLFAEYEYVVAPSGSCVSMIRNHYQEYFSAEDPAYQRVQKNTYELCEFITEVLQVDKIGGNFNHRVALHKSCHGLRELRLGQCSELMPGGPDRVATLLKSIDGLEITGLKRADECCGFGGTFAVVEEAVSVMMGKDRLADFEQHQAEIVTATDVSCLMHLQGIAKRDRSSLRFMHVAEIFASSHNNTL